MWSTPSSTARRSTRERLVAVTGRPEDPGTGQLHRAEADATHGAPGEGNGVGPGRGHARRLLRGRLRLGPAQLIECWYSVKPMPAQTAATIQKRNMIFVSDQAIISKW